MTTYYVLRYTTVSDILNEPQQGYCAINKELCEKDKLDNLSLASTKNASTIEQVAQHLAATMKVWCPINLSFSMPKGMPEYFYKAWTMDMPPTNKRYSKTHLQELNADEERLFIQCLDDLLRKDAAPNQEKFRND